MPPTGLVTVRPLTGLALPAMRRTGGYFSSRRHADLAWGDILLAVFVPRGAQVMARGLGCGLHEQLFQLRSVDPSVIAYTVRDAITQQVPYVRVESVKIAPVDKGYRISIAYSLRSEIETIQEQALVVTQTGAPVPGTF